MIILVGSHKGGVGKSTIYIHILMCLILKSGKRVAALECDDQHSVKDWLDERRSQEPFRMWTTMSAIMTSRQWHVSWTKI